MPSLNWTLDWTCCFFFSLKSVWLPCGSPFVLRRFRSASSPFAENSTLPVWFSRAHPGEWRAQRQSADNRLCRARRQKRLMNQRQTLRRAVRRITCDHITIGSRYSCYIYTRYASRVFTTATMVDGSCLFPLCPALTNTCLQLLTSHFTQAQMWWSDLSDFEWLLSLQRMVPKYNLVVNSIFSS